MDIFCDIVERINHSNFGVNYDPSNTYLIAEDPLELHRRVAHRVVTMHASDRYLKEGTLDELRSEKMKAQGYAQRLCHGEIGQGLNDLDAIFQIAKNASFSSAERDSESWISIENDINGFDKLERNAVFLRNTIAQYWR